MLLRGLFTAEREVAGMRISAFKSEENTVHSGFEGFK